MAYEEIGQVKLITLGGYNRKTRVDNPTSVEGYYLRSEQIKDNFNEGKFKTLYVFKTKGGDVGVVAPSRLDRKLKTATVGAMTLIEFTGEEDTGKGNPVKLFTVKQDRANVLDAATLAEVAKYSEQESEEPSVESDDSEEEPAPTYISKRPVSAPKAQPSSSDQARVAALLKRTS